MTDKSDILKKNLIEALTQSLGIVTNACKICDCTRDTFYRYYNTDPEFKAKVDSINNITLDFAESQLHKKIKEGDTTSIIFFLKTKGKSRGYIERTEIDQNNSGEITVNINNNIV